MSFSFAIGTSFDLSFHQLWSAVVVGDVMAFSYCWCTDGTLMHSNDPATLKIVISHENLICLSCF